VIVDRVADLIDPVTGQWDLERVNECLWPVDASHVCNIPIGLNVDDTWAWRLEPKGNFSVKSAYKLHRSLVENKGNSSGGLHSDNVVEFDWKDIWSCPCPPNVKQFL
jgi:hypothetical protein